MNEKETGRAAARMQKTVTGNIGIQLAAMSKINFWPSTYHHCKKYEGWNFNSGNYLFTTDTK